MRRRTAIDGGEGVPWDADPRNPNSPNHPTRGSVVARLLTSSTTFGEPLPVVYGLAKVKGRNVYMSALSQGHLWAYADTTGWRNQSGCIDLYTLSHASMSTTYIYLSSNAVTHYGSTQAMVGRSIYFRSGTNAGEWRTIVAGFASMAVQVSPALPYVPGSLDFVTIGDAIRGPVASVAIALCEAPITSITAIKKDDGPWTASLAYMTGFGTPPTTVLDTASSTWAPTEADTNAIGMKMAGTALFRATKLGLTEGKVPDLDFKIQGLYTHPADVLYDLLTDVRHGVGLPGASVVTTAYRTYCDAMGWTSVSRTIDARTDAGSLIDELLEQTNSTAIWSEGKFKVIPMGDATVGSYVPVTAVASLGVDQLLFDGSAGPISIERNPESSVLNTFPVKFKSSAADLEEVTQEYIEPAHSVQYGIKRASALDASWINNEAHAMGLSTIKAQRSINIRNTYKFRLSHRWALLEPMDILLLTEPVLGLSAAPVRIKDIGEAEDGTLDVTAWEWPAGASSSIAMPTQAYDGYSTAAFIPVPAGVAASAAQATANNAATVDLANVVADAVTATLIAPSAVTNAKLPAASITDDKYLLVPNGNFWPNPTSEDTMPTGADANTPEWLGITSSPGAAYQGTKFRRVGANGGSYGVIEYTVPANSGDAYRFKAKARLYYSGWYDGYVPAAYSAATTYAVGYFVTYSSVVYCSLQAGNIGYTPSTFPIYWKRVTWLSGTSYAVNAAVVLNGYCYRCLIATSSVSPSGTTASSANWAKVHSQAYLQVKASNGTTDAYTGSAMLTTTSATVWSNVLVDAVIPAGYNSITLQLVLLSGSPIDADAWADFDNISAERVDYRASRALDGASVTEGGYNRVWYKGNVDTATLGGAPNISRLTIGRHRWNTTAKMASFNFMLQPTASTDNLDALRYIEVGLYQQAVLGTGTQGVNPQWQETMRVPFGDRLYRVSSADSSTSNVVHSSATIYAPYVTGGFPALIATLYNAYGPSAANCYYSPTGATDYTNLTNNGTTFPAGWGGTPPVGGDGGGGGSGGGGCPAPWVPISVGLPSISPTHYNKPAGDIQVGDYVWTWREVSDGITQEGGTFNLVTAVSHETNMACRLVLADGRVLELSAQHRVFSNGGWVQVQNLLLGARIEGDYPGYVESVMPVGEIPVVRITVEGAHTYQTDGLLSHNAKPVE